MIRRLRKKLILLVMASLFLVLGTIIAGMNVMNYRNIVSSADTALEMLSEREADGGPAGPSNNGFENMNPAENAVPKGRRDLSDFDISPGSRVESRFFTVTLDKDTGKITDTGTTPFFSVDTDTVEEYVDTISGTGRMKGFVDYFRYYKISEDTEDRIIFLDCGRELDSAKNFLISSILISLIGFALVSAIVAYFSGRIIRPISESYEKQKQFITDAGHEIKTPLAIINADVEVLEMDYEENEWFDDIKKQTKRLTELTNDLVYLAKMEEEERKIEMIDFPLSDVTEEISSSFQAPALAQNKKFLCEIQPMLTMKGEEKAIRQLVSILLDNALKYSPEGGEVSLSLKKQGKMALLTVYNTTTQDMDPEKLPHLFDRFYRMDASRNSSTGGHGIGLSIAQAVVSAHGGKISAETKDGKSLKITALLPLN